MPETIPNISLHIATDNKLGVNTVFRSKYVEDNNIIVNWK